MKEHLEPQGREIFKAFENGRFIPTSVVNGIGTHKLESSWDEDDEIKVLYDKKAINILQGSLSMDEIFCISTCTTTKEIWDILVETHEGTTEVKRSH